MLYLNCVICAELFHSSDDAYVTTCGHMFHNLCLHRWLERSKTCPQCRNKITERNILKLYFNVAANLDSSRLDATSLQEQLDNANLQLKIKEKEIKQGEELKQQLKETQKKSMKIISTLEEKLKRSDFMIRSQMEQIKIMKIEGNTVVELKNEIKELKLRIQLYDDISLLMSSTMEETDKLLESEKNPKTLSTWVSVLKRELHILETKRNEMRNSLKELQNDFRKERNISKKHYERISQLESENYQLEEKVKTLETKSSTALQETISTKNPNVSKVIEEQKRMTISPTIKNTIKIIEESNSPYLNIKSSSIGLAPLFKLNTDVNKNNPLVTNSSVSKNSNSNNIMKKYSIFKKPRIGLTANTLPAKQSRPNFVFNGYGGSEKVSIFDVTSDVDDDETDESVERQRKVPVQSSSLMIRPKTISLNHRLKTGVLRDFQLSKDKKDT